MTRRQQQLKPSFQKSFKTLDLDGDGQLDASEIYAALRAQTQPTGEGPLAVGEEAEPRVSTAPSAARLPHSHGPPPYRTLRGERNGGVGRDETL